MVHLCRAGCLPCFRRHPLFYYLTTHGTEGAYFVPMERATLSLNDKFYRCLQASFEPFPSREEDKDLFEEIYPLSPEEKRIIARSFSSVFCLTVEFKTPDSWFSETLTVTAFVISPTLCVTARHNFLDEHQQGLNVTSATVNYDPPSICNLAFTGPRGRKVTLATDVRRKFSDTEVDPFNPKFWIWPEDVVFLRLLPSEKPFEPPFFVPFYGKEKEESDSTQIAIIEYPAKLEALLNSEIPHNLPMELFARFSKHRKTILQEIFGGGGDKLVAVGNLLNTHLTSVIPHNCPTEKGASGSPLLDTNGSLAARLLERGLVSFLGIHTGATNDAHWNLAVSVHHPRFIEDYFTVISAEIQEMKTPLPLMDYFAKWVQAHEENLSNLGLEISARLKEKIDTVNQLDFYPSSS